MFLDNKILLEDKILTKENNLNNDLRKNFNKNSRKNISSKKIIYSPNANNLDFSNHYLKKCDLETSDCKIMNKDKKYSKNFFLNEVNLNNQIRNSVENDVDIIQNCTNLDNKDSNYPDIKFTKSDYEENKNQNQLETFQNEIKMQKKKSKLILKKPSDSNAQREGNINFIEKSNRKNNNNSELELNLKFQNITIADFNKKPEKCNNYIEKSKTMNKNLITTTNLVAKNNIELGEFDEKNKIKGLEIDDSNNNLIEKIQNDNQLNTKLKKHNNTFSRSKSGLQVNFNKSLNNTSFNKHPDKFLRNNIFQNSENHQIFNRYEKSIENSNQSLSEDQYFKTSKPNENLNNYNTSNKLNKNNSMIKLKNSSLDDINKHNIFEDLVDKNICKNFKENRILIKNLKVYDSLSDDDFNVVKSHCFSINPRSPIKIFIDFAILISFLYTALLIPLKIIEVPIYDDNSFIIEFLIDIFMLLDLLLGFFTGFYDFEENYKNYFTDTFFHYLNGNFLFDFICALPFSTIFNFIDYQVLIKINKKYKSQYHRYIEAYEIISNFKIDYIYSNNSETSTLFKNTILNDKIIRILAILKVLKAIKILDSNQFLSYLKEKLNLESLVNTKTFKFSSYYIYFFFISHILTCIFIFLGTLTYPNWIVNSNLKDAEFIFIYIASLYFNHTTIFTVGYGDIITKNFYEKTYNIILMIVGLMLYSFALSSISELIQHNNENWKRFVKKKDYLNQLNSKYLINQKLFNKISQHLIYEMHKDKSNKNDLLNDLPISLRNEIILSMNEEIINAFNFFKNCFDNDFIIQAVMMLKPTKFRKRDILVKQGDLIEEIIFLKKGYLDLEVSLECSYIKPEDLNKDKFEYNLKKNTSLTNYKSSFTNSISNKKDNSIMEKSFDIFKGSSSYHPEEDIFDKDKKNKVKNKLFLDESDKNFSKRSIKVNFELDKKYENLQDNKFKILSLRQNEHYGDALMIDNKRSPITLKTKSKSAEIFLMAKMDFVLLIEKYAYIIEEIYEKSSVNMRRINAYIKNLKNTKESQEINSKSRTEFRNKFAKSHISDINSNEIIEKSPINIEIGEFDENINFKNENKIPDKDIIMTDHKKIKEEELYVTPEFKNNNCLIKNQDSKEKKNFQTINYKNIDISSDTNLNSNNFIENESNSFDKEDEIQLNDTLLIKSKNFVFYKIYNNKEKILNLEGMNKNFNSGDDELINDENIFKTIIINENIKNLEKSYFDKNRNFLSTLLEKNLFIPSEISDRESIEKVRIPKQEIQIGESFKYFFFKNSNLKFYPTINSIYPDEEEVKSNIDKLHNNNKKIDSEYEKNIFHKKLNIHNNFEISKIKTEEIHDVSKNFSFICEKCKAFLDENVFKFEKKYVINDISKFVKYNCNTFKIEQVNEINLSGYSTMNSDNEIHEIFNNKKPRMNEIIAIEEKEKFFRRKKIKRKEISFEDQKNFYHADNYSPEKAFCSKKQRLQSKSKSLISIPINIKKQTDMNIPNEKYFQNKNLSNGFSNTNSYNNTLTQITKNKLKNNQIKNKNEILFKNQDDWKQIKSETDNLENKGNSNDAKKNGILSLSISKIGKFIEKNNKLSKDKKISLQELSKLMKKSYSLPFKSKYKNLLPYIIKPNQKHISKGNTIMNKNESILFFNKGDLEKLKFKINNLKLKFKEYEKVKDLKEQHSLRKSINQENSNIKDIHKQNIKKENYNSKSNSSKSLDSSVNSYKIKQINLKNKTFLIELTESEIKIISFLLNDENLIEKGKELSIDFNNKICKDLIKNTSNLKINDDIRENEKNKKSVNKKKLVRSGFRENINKNLLFKPLQRMNNIMKKKDSVKINSFKSNNIIDTLKKSTYENILGQKDIMNEFHKRIISPKVLTSINDNQKSNNYLKSYSKDNITIKNLYSNLNAEKNKSFEDKKYSNIKSIVTRLDKIIDILKL